MITLAIVYGTLVGAFFALGADLIERGLRGAGRQARGVWLLAALATLGTTALLVQRSTEPLPRVEYVVGERGPQVRVTERVGGATVINTTDILPQSWWEPIVQPIIQPRIIPVVSVRWLTTVDTSLGVLWLVAAVAWLGVLVASAIAMQRGRARWARNVVDGTPVYVSHDVGPAVFGALHPSIVVPDWVLGVRPHEQAMILRHEREHVHGRDPALFALGSAFVAIMPLNAALWWIFARLRAAVELDCDQRVLDAGTETHAYGTLLLDVGERMLAAAIPVAALAESHTLTKRRIEAMTAVRSRFATVRALAFLTLGATIALGATRAPRPRLVEREGAPADLVVWPGEVRLMIAIPHRAVWEWNRPSSGDREYSFDVTVAPVAPTCGAAPCGVLDSSDNMLYAVGATYSFGFSYWKHGDSTQRGDLLALLRAGQKSFWISFLVVDSTTSTSTRGGAKTGSTVTKTRSRIPANAPTVTVEPIGDSLLVSIQDRAWINDVFLKHRPLVATVGISTPYQQEVSIPITIRYADR